MIRNGNIERNYPSRDDGTAIGVCHDHLIRYEMASKYTEGKIVLDAANGCGYACTILKAKHYTGYDISDDAVNYANTVFAGPDRLFLKKDIDTLPLGTYSPEHKYDVIVSFETIEHIQNPEAFLSWTLLMADTILVSTPIALPGKYGMHSPYHTVEWYAQEFIDLCEDKASQYNSLVGTNYPQFKVTYFWEFDDGPAYITNLDLQNLPNNGVIISVFQKM